MSGLYEDTLQHVALLRMDGGYDWYRSLGGGVPLAILILLGVHENIVAAGWKGDEVENLKNSVLKKGHN